MVLRFRGEGRRVPLSTAGLDEWTVRADIRKQEAEERRQENRRF